MYVILDRAENYNGFLKKVRTHRKKKRTCTKKKKNPQEEKKNLHEEKKNPQEEKTNLQEEKANWQLRREVIRLDLLVQLSLVITPFVGLIQFKYY